jgi:hypothetical protein
VSPKTARSTEQDFEELQQALIADLQPLEAADKLIVLTDNRTGARYCECHVRANKIVSLGTIDVPLDPDEQSDYRANREMVENAPAFGRMKDDAKKRRSFSNIVAEFTREYDEDHPLKIIGGQHRFTAIQQALSEGIDELHGLKIYLGLSMDQRFDAQLISNTVIDVAADLLDRMTETRSGPELRNWCHVTGLLQVGEDFGDKQTRGGALTVRMARNFIKNFFSGRTINPKQFSAVDTTPTLSPSGVDDEAWEKLKSDRPDMWSDPDLRRAGEEFTRLTAAQRNTFAKNGKKGVPLDFPHKATNLAVMAAWAFVAGVLQENKLRLEKHYALANRKGGDPLNASALAQGRHRTDPPQYRGLGNRSDAKERGRLAELFFLQAEDGEGIKKQSVERAIAAYQLKLAQLEVLRLESQRGA